MSQIITFRKAQFDDWKILLEWRNDPMTRENSINSDLVTKADHQIWLKNSLLNPKRALWIAMLSTNDQTQQSFGTIRCDVTEDAIVNRYSLDISTQELSWTLSPVYRGQGLGYSMLKNFCDLYKQSYLARIKKENIASHHMVKKCGFKLLGETSGISFYKL